MKGRFTNSSNPLINDKALKKKQYETGDFAGQSMSVGGAVDKSLILGVILVAVSVLSYGMANNFLLFGGMIGGLMMVIISVMKPQYSAITAPLYAAFTGLFVGSVTSIYAMAYDGIVFQAISLTVAILFGMLFLYKSGIIKVTPQFRTGVIMATFGILAVYILSFILSLFGINVPFLHENSMMGIGISLLIIGVAALNLLLDFDNFDKGEQMGLPKYYEWFFGMGLMITLVWLYLEILRLLSILSSD